MYSPEPHQVNAINDILYSDNGIIKNDRALFISACGTGKTFTGYNVIHGLESKVVLLLFPSIALIEQVNEEYAFYNEFNTYDPLYICSDDEISNEGIPISIDELAFSTTTNTEDIITYLKSDLDTKIVFSTYHSSYLLLEVFKQTGIEFDIALYDEAHRVAQGEFSAFSSTLLDEDIKIKKRLFMTATPRHHSLESIGNKDGGIDKIYSMDNEDVFGKIAHNYSFSQAIQDEVITDYKIVLNVTESKEVILDSSPIKEHREISRQAKEVALAKAIKKTEVKKVIAFAERIKKSKEYAQGIKNKGVNEFDVEHIDSRLNKKDRKVIFEQFKRSEKAVLFNANLLSEGVDVPSVDMVAFLENTSSAINIVQRVGRAIRKDALNPTKIGYIMVPIFVDIQKGESIEDAVFGSEEWNRFFSVLNYIREIDSRLNRAIESLSIGSSSTYSLSDFVDIDFDIEGAKEDPDLTKRLISATSALVVEKLGDKWDIQFELLRKYKETHGVLPGKQEVVGGYRLGRFIIRQRAKYRNNELSEEKIDKLNSLEVSFLSHEEIWEERYQIARTYYLDNGEPPRGKYKSIDYASFYTSCKKQYQKGTLPDHKIDALRDIDVFVLEEEQEAHKLKAFSRMLKLTEEYIELNNCIPKTRIVYKNEFIGRWFSEQKVKYKKNAHPYPRLLKDLIPYFDKKEREWDELYGLTKEYLAENQKLPSTKVIYKGMKIGAWIKNTKVGLRDDRLSDEKKKLLETIGIKYVETKRQSIEERLVQLISFRDKHGSFPSKKENITLNMAYQRIRQMYAKGKLPKELMETCIENNVALVIDQWEERYLNLKRKYHSGVEFDGSDRQWLSKQNNKFKKGELENHKIKKLETIGHEFPNLDQDKFAINFKRLKEYVDTHKALPSSKTKLGAWYRNTSRPFWNKMSKKKEQEVNQLREYLEEKEVWCAKEQYKEKIKLYLEYREKHGDIRGGKGIPVLGAWVERTRSQNKKGELPVWKKEMLIAINFPFIINRKKEKSNELSS